MINALIRAVYRVAHWGLRLLWFIRRPETSGALVAVWHHGRVLLVKNSYRPQLTLPGGYIRPREERRTAAAPNVRVDNREVVRAEFHTPDEALGMEIVPHLEEYLSRRIEREAD